MGPMHGAGPMGGPPPMGRPPMRGGPHNNMPPRHGPKPNDADLFADDFSDKEFDLKQMEAESEEMVKMTLLNRQNASFQKTSGGDLHLTFQGVSYERIQLVETFPFTDPYVYLSVRDTKGKHKEIGMIEDLEADFDLDTISLIKDYLEQHYHMPAIEKIIRAKENGSYTDFTVLTNYGENQFSLRANGSHITALSENRLIIQDLENNRFEIPDKNKLSAKELKLLDVFL